MADNKKYVVLDTKDKDGKATFDPPSTDFTEETKNTLGDYLNKIIGDSPNTFKVSYDPKANVPSPDYNTNSATTPPIQTGGAGVADLDTFLGNIPSEAQNNFTTEGPDFSYNRMVEPGAEWPPNNEDADALINKSERNISNNTSLADFVPVGGYRGQAPGGGLLGQKQYDLPEGAKKIQENISTVLQYNRFNPSGQTPFIDDGNQLKSQDDSPILYYNQGELGKYSSSDALHAATLQDFQDLAMRMMQNATGHANTGLGDSDGLTDVTNVQEGHTQVDIYGADGVLPLGVATGLEMFGPDGKFQIPNSEIVGEGAKSFGQLNSPAEPFDGPFPAGMVVLAATSLAQMWLFAQFIQLLIAGPAAIGGLFGGSGDFSSLGEGTIGTDNGINPMGNRPSTWDGYPGQHAPVDKSTGGGLFAGLMTKFLKMLGIPDTHHAWEGCIVRGIELFFGFGRNGLSSLFPGGGAAATFIVAGLGANIVSMAENLLLSSGYYASVMRSVMRDTAQIESAWGDMTGLLGGPQGGLLGLVSSIVNSTTWRWVMVMATLGDRALDADNLYFSPHATNPNALPPAPANRLAKSRVRGGNDQLAWGGNQALSLMLLPRGLQTATAFYKLADIKGSGKISGGVGASLMAGLGLTKFSEDDDKGDVRTTGGLATSNNGIIDPALVKRMEAYLDGEFCPFYFHDLRTNEILSFHAFITNLNETFNPTWGTYDAYGRMDDVMTLQKTTRQLSLSFVIASTNPVDQAGMWYKVNKLVSMIYPQWSPGTMVQGPNSGERFRMPFSQIPTASPIIRLRIGDLVSSNYSRFGLSRLFGLGDANVLSTFGNSATADEITQGIEGLEEGIAQEIIGIKTQIGAGNGPDAGTIPTDMKKLRIRLNQDIKSVKVTNNTTTTPNPSPRVINKIRAGTLFKVKDNIPRKGEDNIGISLSKEAHKVIGAKVFDTDDEASPLLLAAGNMKYKVSFKLPSGDEEEVEIELDPKKVNISIDEASLYATAFDKASESAELNSSVNIGLLKKFFAGKEAESEGGTPNPIVRSFESTMGKGLAGAVTSLAFGYNDAPWGDEFGAKAPIWTTVDLTFNVIHDITPGLASDGSLRAPTHSVGSVVKDLHGSVYDKEYKDKALRAINRSRGIADPSIEED
tara:strand:+ start:1983 stop:5405 length:3423 start_codon:yes stop_codon:yes gene_type:complete